MMERSGYEQGLLGVRSPHAIVEDARLLMRQHLAEPLTLRSLAKALVMSAGDLEASFRLAAHASFDEEIAKLRLNTLYELMRSQPMQSLEGLVAQVGLQWNDGLERAFEEAFWISLQDHHQHCRQCGAQLPT
jgi:transcriptional regulator GlxA family with amidase domain